MRIAPLVAAAAVFAACGPGATPEELQALEDQDPEALPAMQPLTRAGLPAATKRVVLARMYQHGSWTIAAADEYDTAQFPDRKAARIAYVCDALTKLKPTWVSGLVRVDADDELSPDMIETYNGIKSCVRHNVGPVRFDVVLNALHYTDEGQDPETAIARFRARFDSIRKSLHPDLYFFDFYSLPFNEQHKRHRAWHPAAMERIIEIIQGHDRLVGGNVWSLQAPKGSDFVALDNFDREHTSGMAFVRDQIEQFRKDRPDMPVLMHIENNPQKDPSKGLTFIHADPGEQRDTVVRHVSLQSMGYAYMFPTFFPLEQVEVPRANPDPECKPTEDDPCDTRLAMRSYDAAQAGLLDLYAKLMKQ